MFGARKRTRTSTPLRELAPEASASANSAIRALEQVCEANSLCPRLAAFVNAPRGTLLLLHRGDSHLLNRPTPIRTKYSHIVHRDPGPLLPHKPSRGTA